jgi:hypothetical protein
LPGVKPNYLALGRIGYRCEHAQFDELNGFTLGGIIP